MDAQESHSRDWGFITNWTLMTLAGLMLGTTVRQFILPFIYGVVGGGTLGSIVEGALIGLTIGLAQQLALPPTVSRRAGWSVGVILGWAVGWSFGWGIGWRLLGQGGFGLNFAAIGLIAGLIAGLGQWFLLQRQVEQAGWWLVVSPVAWALGLAVGMSVGGAFGWPLAGGVAGIISGLALDRLRQYPNPDFSKSISTPH